MSHTQHNFVNNGFCCCQVCVCLLYSKGMTAKVFLIRRQLKRSEREEFRRFLLEHPFSSDNTDEEKLEAFWREKENRRRQKIRILEETQQTSQSGLGNGKKMYASYVCSYYMV